MGRRHNTQKREFLAMLAAIGVSFAVLYGVCYGMLTLASALELPTFAYALLLPISFLLSAVLAGLAFHFTRQTLLRRRK